MVSKEALHQENPQGVPAQLSKDDPMKVVPSEQATQRDDDTQDQTKPEDHHATDGHEWPESWSGATAWQSWGNWSDWTWGAGWHKSDWKSDWDQQPLSQEQGPHHAQTSNTSCILHVQLSSSLPARRPFLPPSSFHLLSPSLTVHSSSLLTGSPCCRLCRCSSLWRFVSGWSRLHQGLCFGSGLGLGFPQLWNLVSSAGKRTEAESCGAGSCWVSGFAFSEASHSQSRQTFCLRQPSVTLNQQAGQLYLAVEMQLPTPNPGCPTSCRSGSRECP